MQVIIYKFVDGTTSIVEVTEDIYLIQLELLQQEKRNHWKETRRHTSLYYFTDMGIDFEDKRIDLFAEIVRKENAERVHKALLTLSDKRRDLVRTVLTGKKCRQRQIVKGLRRRGYGYMPNGR